MYVHSRNHTPYIHALHLPYPTAVEEIVPLVSPMQAVESGTNQHQKCKDGKENKGVKDIKVRRIMMAVITITAMERNAAMGREYITQ